jgi:hypothetical protein
VQRHEGKGLLNGSEETGRVQKANCSRSQAHKHRLRHAIEQAQAPAVETLQRAGAMRDMIALGGFSVVLAMLAGFLLVLRG